MTISEADHVWMRSALTLAREGEGWVEPNPMVGCVLVAGGREIGRGYHARYGQAHAEPLAISDAIQRGFEKELTEATAYVTLEPCCHHGKTPPCTQALIHANVRRIVVAMRDPFDQVSGKGMEQLRQHGIMVEVGIEEALARQLNAPYLKRVHQQLPWVIAKWAMSLDGKIATRSGNSQWISCPLSRSCVHQIRGRVDAILVGSRTVLADNPLLTARAPAVVKRKALRVVADRRLQVSLDSQLVQTAQQFPTLIFTSSQADPSKVADLRNRLVDVVIARNADRESSLLELLRYLAQEKGVTNLLVEGGAELLGTLADIQQIDQCEIFIAPMVLGGQAAKSAMAGIGPEFVKQAMLFRTEIFEKLGRDVHLQCVRNVSE